MDWRKLLARLRVPLLVATMVLLVVGGNLDLPAPVRLGGFVAVYWFLIRAGTLHGEAIEVTCPMTGRLVAVNSPADRVPSHGIQVYGQTYAIDLVHEPADRRRPGLGWWPLARRPGDFPSFGQPVHAPADGTVVRVHSRERDHWSRTSWWGLAYMFLVEGIVRELTGPSRVLGNHVVMQLDRGVYAVLAHLRRRSILVTEGDRVRAGDLVAECGNSGNSSEPHVHLQLMDHRYVLLAAGLPMSFRYEVDGTSHTGLPRAKQPFEVAHQPQHS